MNMNDKILELTNSNFLGGLKAVSIMIIIKVVIFYTYYLIIC